MRAGDLIELSDNKTYLICSKIQYAENDYYNLVENENIDNIKFCEHDKKNNRMNVVEDLDLLNELMPLFSKESYRLLNEITAEENN